MSIPCEGGGLTHYFFLKFGFTFFFQKFFLCAMNNFIFDESQLQPNTRKRFCCVVERYDDDCDHLKKRKIASPSFEQTLLATDEDISDGDIHGHEHTQPPRRRYSVESDLASDGGSDVDSIPISDLWEDEAREIEYEDLKHPSFFQSFKRTSSLIGNIFSIYSKK